MKISILPRKGLSILAVVLAFMWPLYSFMGFLLVNVVYQGVAAGNGLIDDLHARPLLAATILLGLALGTISLPISLVAIFKKGERSILSILAALLGLLSLIILVSELVVNV
ncbi:MAG TPA: hypothetical protein VJG48_03625 [Candidatus Paceibacterota bacterium]